MIPTIGEYIDWAVTNSYPFDITQNEMVRIQWFYKLFKSLKAKHSFTKGVIFGSFITTLMYLNLK
jgi:hypothetical protein